MYLVNHSFEENKENYILWTIQGEGGRIGRPSMFLRFGGCNLNCRGFKCKYNDYKTGEEKIGCDSWFAVDMSYKETWKKITCMNDVLSLIIKTKPQNFTDNYDIVITGGEPLIYWKNEIFQKLLRYFIENEKRVVTIETNGTIDIKFTEDYQKKVIFSVSPKLSISGEFFEKRFKPEVIKNYFKNANGYLKFVTSCKTYKKDLEEIEEYLKEIRGVNIYLMPLGETNEENMKNYGCLVNICKQKGFILSPRLHIIIWDKKKGV